MKQRDLNREREEEEEQARGISTVVGMTTVGEDGEEKKEKMKLMPAGLTGKKRNARTPHTEVDRGDETNIGKWEEGHDLECCPANPQS